ncbi:MAG: hypothetical protein PHU14_12685 [Methylovulum sp.]|nr:hypothetical protein [Methylovulum sp.]
MNHALSKIKAADFVVELDGTDLVVSPFSKLTPYQVLFLRSHKAEIVQALKHGQAANDSQGHSPDDDRHYCHECQNLINGRCMASPIRYSPVDTHPRRCVDFVMGM